MDTEVELALRELQGLAVLVRPELLARDGLDLQDQLGLQAQGSPGQAGLQEPLVQLGQVVRQDRPELVLRGRLVLAGLRVRPGLPALKESPVPQVRLAQPVRPVQLVLLDRRDQAGPLGQRVPQARQAQADQPEPALLVQPARVDLRDLQELRVAKVQLAQVRISTT